MGDQLKAAMERELKLCAPADFVLPAVPGQPIEPRRFTSTYFDTENLLLAKAQMTLRRRVERQKGLWQLKLPKADGRLEIEAPGGPAGPPPSMLSLLTGVLRGGSLKSVAKIRTDRTGFIAQHNGVSIAEVVLDKFQVLEPSQGLGAFQEIEIELLEGGFGDLKDLEVALRHAGAGKGDSRPKVFQALGLKPPKAKKPQRNASDLSQLQSAVAEQLDQILRHDPGTRLGSDPEDLHQLRVAIRRLRCFLGAASPFLAPDWANSLRRELEWAGDFLNPVRDLDVMIPHIELESVLLGQDEASRLSPFLAKLREDHGKARQDMMKGLDSGRYLALLVALDDATITLKVRPGGPTLRQIAAAHFNELRKAASKPGSDSSDEQQHKIRILTKRSRFAAELAEHVGGKASRAYAQRAKQVQDVLGEHQDAAVTEARIRTYVETLSNVKEAFASGRLVERQLSRKKAARADFPAAWRALERSGKKAWRQT